MQTRFRWPGGEWLAGPVYERGITALFCGLLAPLIAAVYMLARTGFDNPVRPVAAAVAISWTLTVVPFALYAMLNRSRTGDWYRSEGFLTLAIAVILALCGLLARRGAGLLLIFELLAVVAVGWTVAVLWSRTSLGRKALFFLATSAYAVWIAGVEWANGFLNPLFVENLVLHGGDKHIDTLFHMSVANMIGTYGTPSIGWDGVPMLTYHFGSAWFFAQLAGITGMTVVQFFQLGVPVILIPFCLRAILVLAAEVRERARPMVAEAKGRGWFLIFFFLACATVGFLPAAALHSVGVWGIGPFLSESHVLAMTIALLFLAVIAVFAKQRSPVEQMPGGASVYFFLLVFVPVATASIGVVKVSQMLLLLAFAVFVLIRFRLYRNGIVLLSALLTFALALFTYRTVVWSGLNEGLTPLSFLRSEIPLAWWPLFPILHLVWTWTYTYVRLKSERASTISDVRALIGSRKIVDVELVVGIAIVGLLPGLVFNIRADAYYFSDFQRWFALALLLGNLFLLTGQLAKRDLLPSFRVSTIRTMRIERLMVTVALACVLLTMGITVLNWTRSLVRANLDARRELQEVAAVRPSASLGGSVKRFIRHPANADFRMEVSEQVANLHNAALFRRALQSSERYSLVNTLLKIGQLPRGERQESLIYVDPSLDTFWNFIPYARTCEYSVMIGPALAGTALMDGVPAGCDLNGFYGTEAYPEKDSVRGSVPIVRADLCREANRRGFTRVIHLSPLDKSHVAAEKMACTPSQRE